MRKLPDSLRPVLDKDSRICDEIKFQVRGQISTSNPNFLKLKVVWRDDTGTFFEECATCDVGASPTLTMQFISSHFSEHYRWPGFCRVINPWSVKK